MRESTQTRENWSFKNGGIKNLCGIFYEKQNLNNLKKN